MSVQPQTSKALNSTGTNQRHKCEKLMQFLLVRIHFEVVYPPLNTNREGLLFDQTWLSNRDLIILAFNSTVVFSSFERCSSSSSLLPKWGEKEKKKKRRLISLMAVERQISLSLSCLAKDWSKKVPHIPPCWGRSVGGFRYSDWTPFFMKRSTGILIRINGEGGHLAL